LYLGGRPAEAEPTLGILEAPSGANLNRKGRKDADQISWFPSRLYKRNWIIHSSLFAVPAYALIQHLRKKTAEGVNAVRGFSG
jgi:hypothetical protein